MTRKTRSHVDDIRGASRLALEATRSVTDLVEAMHRTIGGGPEILGRPVEGATRVFTSPIYETIRVVTRWVGAGMDVALEQLAPLLGEGAPGPERDSVLAVLNGVLGDYLSETCNPLAIRMQLRHGGHSLDLERAALRAAFPEASGKLLVLVHGSCRNDLQWLRSGHDHGAALARELGYTPVYLLYNSGLHISINGRAFAELLEALVAEWPAPLEQLVILGHSMGGLVARSACHFGEVGGQRWRTRLGKLVCLGSPHHGAALERAGSWVHLLLGVSRYSAPFAALARIRSAGVTDMRFGYVLDADWQDRDRFAHRHAPHTLLPLPDGVDCYAIAGTTAAHPGGNLPGDGLVSVNSALGKHTQPALTLRFPAAHQYVAFGTGHLDLLDRPEVYATLRDWLS